MNNDIFTAIRPELEKFDAAMKKILTLKVGQVSDYAHIDLDVIENHIRPAVLFLSAKLFGCTQDYLTKLASVLQLIFMASVIHTNIPDQDKKGKVQDVRDGSQFPVLIGDFLFGKFFSILATLPSPLSVSMTDLYSNAICTMYEGEVLKKELLDNKDDENYLKMIYQSKADLFATGCLVGAIAANATEDECSKLKSFGANLGMAYGILTNEDYSVRAKEKANFYLEKAINDLEFFSDSEIKQALLNIIELFRLNNKGTLKVLAI